MLAISSKIDTFAPSIGWGDKKKNHLTKRESGVNPEQTRYCKSR